MTLAEITAECQRYQREYSKEVPEKEVDEPYVAWCLVKLAEWGMVQVVSSENKRESPDRFSSMSEE